MRVSSVNTSYNQQIQRNYELRKNNPVKHSQYIAQPSFKESNVGKIVGGIAGFAAMCVFAPAVVAVGLGGIGVLGGLVAGNIIDEKIDEHNDKKN